MRASSVFVSAVAFAVASAQSSSVDPFPQTSYLQQTNSLGVVTGQPAVATAQPSVATEQPGLPAAVTSQPGVNSIPAVGTGITTLYLPGPASNVNGTQTLVVSANNSTTIVLNPATTSSDASATGSDATKSGASKTGTATGSGAAEQSTGAAVANVKVAAGSFVGFGAFLAAFL